MRMKLFGVNHLMKQLDKLSRSARNKILRPAVTAGARPVRKQARANLGGIGGTRNLEKSIDTKIGTSKKGIYAVIGPRSDIVAERTNIFGRSVRYRPSFIASQVETGIAPHVIMIGRGRKTTWNHPGTTGKKFMSRAWETTSGQAQKIIYAKIAEGLNKL